MLPKRTFNVSKIIKSITFYIKRPFLHIREAFAIEKIIKMMKKLFVWDRIWTWDLLIQGLSLCWLSYWGNEKFAQKKLFYIHNRKCNCFPSSLYSLERMEGIPLFFLWSIYMCQRISRNGEIIHIQFWPGTPESNQRPITC